jgi:hypothetical protein
MNDEDIEQLILESTSTNTLQTSFNGLDAIEFNEIKYFSLENELIPLADLIEPIQFSQIITFLNQFIQNNNKNDNSEAVWNINESIYEWNFFSASEKNLQTWLYPLGIVMNRSYRQPEDQSQFLLKLLRKGSKMTQSHVKAALFDLNCIVAAQQIFDYQSLINNLAPFTVQTIKNNNSNERIQEVISGLPELVAKSIIMSDEPSEITEELLFSGLNLTSVYEFPDNYQQFLQMIFHLNHSHELNRTLYLFAIFKAPFEALRAILTKNNHHNWQILYECSATIMPLLYFLTQAEELQHCFTKGTGQEIALFIKNLAVAYKSSWPEGTLAQYNQWFNSQGIEKPQGEEKSNGSIMEHEFSVVAAVQLQMAERLNDSVNGNKVAVQSLQKALSLVFAPDRNDFSQPISIVQQ